MTRDDEWVRLDDVRASIGEFVDQVGREPLRIDVGHATLHVTRAGEQFAVDYYGDGGGWFDARRVSRRELVSYVDTQETTIRLKRPESQRQKAEA